MPAYSSKNSVATVLNLSEVFHYRNGLLHAEDCPLDELAERFGTPLYIYSKQALYNNHSAYADALNGMSHLLCYSVKANSNGSLLKLLADWGSGFDVVSGGELQQVIRVGGDADKIIFSGVGKTAEEIELALRQKIYCLNIESEAELLLVEQLAARLQQVAPVAVRINPEISAGAHPHISTALNTSKFGVSIPSSMSMIKHINASRHLHLVGLACHIGSQITELQPLLAALDQLLELAKQTGWSRFTTAY